MQLLQQICFRAWNVRSWHILKSANINDVDGFSKVVHFGVCKGKLGDINELNPKNKNV
jgi:hypothetical protein